MFCILPQKRLFTEMLTLCSHMDFPFPYVNSFPLHLSFLHIQPGDSFMLRLQKLISSVCFANQPLWGLFSFIYRRLLYYSSTKRKGLMCSQPTKTLLFNKTGLGQPFQPAHSSAHSRLAVMKICIYIVPCTCHNGIAVGGSVQCRKVTCVPDLMNWRTEWKDLH